MQFIRSLLQVLIITILHYLLSQSVAYFDQVKTNPFLFLWLFWKQYINLAGKHFLREIFLKCSAVKSVPSCILHKQGQIFVLLLSYPTWQISHSWCDCLVKGAKIFLFSALPFINVSIFQETNRWGEMWCSSLIDITPRLFERYVPGRNSTD